MTTIAIPTWIIDLVPHVDISTARVLLALAQVLYDPTFDAATLRIADLARMTGLSPAAVVHGLRTCRAHGVTVTLSEGGAL